MSNCCLPKKTTTSFKRIPIINKIGFLSPVSSGDLIFAFSLPIYKRQCSGPSWEACFSERYKNFFMAKDPRYEMTSIPENSWLHSPRKSSPGFPLLICFPEVLWVNTTMSKLKCPGIQSTIEHYRTLPTKTLGILGGLATQQNKLWFWGGSSI